MNLVEEMQRNAGVELNEGKKMKKALVIAAIITAIGANAMKSNSSDWKEGLSPQEVQYVQSNKEHFDSVRSQLIKSGVGGKELEKLLKKKIAAEVK